MKMRTIFGKEGRNGTAEMQRYFSHIPGTIEYWEMEAEVLAAQEELHRFVGCHVVDEALEHYHSDMFQAEPDDSGSGDSSGGEPENLKLLDRLVYYVQSAVALTGYREYALNNDATHTKTGRMARMDKDSDEWTEKLIDRDDFALQRKGQRAIDRLIAFVDKKKMESWTKSDVYAQTKELLLWNTDLFNRFHPIESSRRLYMLLLPMIRSAQRDFIEPVLGDERWEALMAKVKANDLTGKATKLLFDKAGAANAYIAMSSGFQEIPVQLFPENMSRQFWNAGNGIAFIALRDKLIANLYDEGIRKLKILEHYVRKIEADELNHLITNDEIKSIADRMDKGNRYARV